MRALVVYESMFGISAAIAEAVAATKGADDTRMARPALIGLLDHARAWGRALAEGHRR